MSTTFYRPEPPGKRRSVAESKPFGTRPEKRFELTGEVRLVVVVGLVADLGKPGGWLFEQQSFGVVKPAEALVRLQVYAKQRLEFTFQVAETQRNLIFEFRQ